MGTLLVNVEYFHGVLYSEDMVDVIPYCSQHLHVPAKQKLYFNQQILMFYKCNYQEIGLPHYLKLRKAPEEWNLKS